MKFLIEEAEHNGEVTQITLRFGDISISGFTVEDNKIIYFPDNLTIPFELREDIEGKLFCVHARLKRSFKS